MKPPIMGLAEIHATAEIDAIASRVRRRWGNWRLDTADMSLVYDRPGAGRYWIALARITSGAEALDWIAQVNGKGWASPADVGDLVAALDDIFCLQGNLCGMGRNKSLDAAVYLRRRYAPDAGAAA
jgi:hypothetical protein